MHQKWEEVLIMSDKTFTPHVKDPFVRVVRRDNLPMWKAWLYRFIAIVLALGLVDIFVSE